MTKLTTEELKDIVLMIATPMYGGMCHSSYVSTLLDIKHWAMVRWKINVQFNFVGNQSSINHARNQLTEYFLNSESTHMLFLDADNAFPGEYLEDMLRSNLDVIGLACAKKTIDWDRVADVARRNPDMVADNLRDITSGNNVIFDDLKTDFRTPLEVQAVGTGVMLIKRSVFEKLRAAQGESLAYRVDGYDLYEYFREGRTPQGDRLSEDYNFCKQWRDLGGLVHVMPYIPTIHEGQYRYEMNLPYQAMTMGRS